MRLTREAEGELPLKVLAQKAPETLEKDPNPEMILNVCLLPEIHYDTVEPLEDDDEEEEQEEEEPEVREPRRKAIKRPASSMGGGYMGYDLSGRKPDEGHGKKFYSLKKELGFE